MYKVFCARNFFGLLGVAISLSITAILISNLLHYIISNSVTYCSGSLRGKFFLNVHADLGLSKFNELGPASWLYSFKFLH